MQLLYYKHSAFTTPVGCVPAHLTYIGRIYHEFEYVVIVSAITITIGVVVKAICANGTTTRMRSRYMRGRR